MLEHLTEYLRDLGNYGVCTDGSILCIGLEELRSGEAGAPPLEKRCGRYCPLLRRVNHGALRHPMELIFAGQGTP